MIELVDLATTMCRTPACPRVAWRRGLCGTCYRAVDGARVAHRGLEPEEEPDDLDWHATSRAELHALRVLDRLLLAIEEHNLREQPRTPAPPALIARYRNAGGELVWGKHPSGGALHAATLDLQEQYVRRPMIRTPTTMMQAATLAE